MPEGDGAAGADELKGSGRYVSDSVIAPSASSSSSSTEETNDDDPLAAGGGDDEGGGAKEGGGSGGGGSGGNGAQRLGFLQALSIHGALKKKLKIPHLITVITTSVTTTTTTSTFYSTVSTKTFFIQLCTPSPFPFDICASKKKRK